MDIFLETGNNSGTFVTSAKIYNPQQIISLRLNKALFDNMIDKVVYIGDYGNCQVLKKNVEMG